MRYILAVFIAAVVVKMPASLALPEKSKNNNKSLKTSVSFLGKIKNIIVLMLENRSFDHFFGDDGLGFQEISEKAILIHPEPDFIQYSVTQACA